jgi:hypothetical protein
MSREFAMLFDERPRSRVFGGLAVRFPFRGMIPAVQDRNVALIRLLQSLDADNPTVSNAWTMASSSACEPDAIGDASITRRASRASTHARAGLSAAWAQVENEVSRRGRW